MLRNTKAFLIAGVVFCGGFPYGLAQCQSLSDIGGKVLLREGTEVPLAFAQDLSSKNAVEGDTVVFALKQDLSVNGVIVARAGTKATGEVTNAKKAAMMGKGGELNVRLEQLNVADAKVRIRGSKGSEGDSKVGAAVALTVLFGPVGFLKHGQNIEIREGTSLTAYVAADVALPAAR